MIMMKYFKLIVNVADECLKEVKNATDVIWFYQVDENGIILKCFRIIKDQYNLFKTNKGVCIKNICGQAHMIEITEEEFFIYSI